MATWAFVQFVERRVQDFKYQRRLNSAKDSEEFLSILLEVAGYFGGVVADEKAIFVTNQNNTYELRLKYVGTTNVDNASPGSYYTQPRCCIWRL